MNTDPSTVPTALSLNEEGELLIEWSDDVRQQMSPAQILERCPCATCREKRKAKNESQPVLAIAPADSSGPVRITAMAPVGNYAYSIEFDSGCSKGIYTFELLRQL